MSPVYYETEPVPYDSYTTTQISHTTFSLRSTSSLHDHQTSSEYSYASYNDFISAIDTGSTSYIVAIVESHTVLSVSTIILTYIGPVPKVSEVRCFSPKQAVA